jgi:hypothetical protein
MWLRQGNEIDGIKSPYPLLFFLNLSLLFPIAIPTLPASIDCDLLPSRTSQVGIRANDDPSRFQILSVDL